MSGKQISIWVTQEMATRFFVTLSKNEELPRCAKFRKPCTSPRVWDIFAHTHPNPHRMYASKFAFEWSKTRIKRARTEKNRISNHESHCLFSTFSSPYKINKVQRDWNWIGKMAFSWKLVKSHFCATILLNSIHRIWYFYPDTSTFYLSAVAFIGLYVLFGAFFAWFHPNPVPSSFCLRCFCAVQTITFNQLHFIAI